MEESVSDSAVWSSVNTDLSEEIFRKDVVIGVSHLIE